MVAVKLELVATLSSGMIFRRKATPHVIYCVKKLLPYKLYQVELDLNAKKLAFHTLIGDEVHTCEFRDHMLWEQVREELSDHLGVETWQIRFMGGPKEHAASHHCSPGGGRSLCPKGV